MNTRNLINMGTTDRALRLTVGIVLVYFGLITQSLTDSALINLVSGIFGLTNIISAAIRVCPAYLASGLSTCPGSKKSSANESVSPMSNNSPKADSQSNQAYFETTFKQKLLLSITLPVTVVLLIFAYLTYEQSKEHKLLSETAAVRAVAKMAVDIESHSDLVDSESLSKEIVAIVIHDAKGKPIPSVIEKLPTDPDYSSVILSQITSNPGSRDNNIWQISEQNLLRVTKPIQGQGMHVSVFYDTRNAKSYNVNPLLSRLGFTALLAIWLSGWAAYSVTKRYTTYVSRNSEAVKYRSTHDVLTGLLNRAGLDEALEKKADQSNTRRNAKDAAFSVLIIDIINFHYFNDTLGHKLGDDLLRNVAQRLQKSLHPDESLVRLNGDVFCIVTEKGLDAQDSLSRANEIRSLFTESMLFQEIQLDIQCRIGIANFPEHTEEVSDLLRLGVIALEHTKNLGKSVSIYDASRNTHSVKKLTVLTGLVTAMEENQLYMAYQPKIDVCTGHLHGVEALIRWQHPIYQNIAPFEFISWAEKSGLINALTQWILVETEKQSKRWQSQGLNIPIAINLSPVNFQDNIVVNTIVSSVTTGYFQSGMLELEITENAVVQESDNALKQMKEFHSLGVPISIDDFGSGLASFSYLRNFPVSNLKIDRTFVNLDNPDTDDYMLLKSMIELGHNLNCVVTAEGVENAETLEVLRSLGCDYAQGYHICKPTSADGIVEWMTSNNVALDDDTSRCYLREVA